MVSTSSRCGAPPSEPVVEPTMTACIGLSYDESVCKTQIYAPDWFENIYIYGSISLWNSGDANGDGVIDEEDLDYVMEGITTGKYCRLADLNQDGKVDLADYAIVQQNQGEKVADKLVLVRWLLDPLTRVPLWAFPAETDEYGKFAVQIVWPEFVAWVGRAILEAIVFRGIPYPEAIPSPLFFDVLLPAKKAETGRYWKTVQSEVLSVTIPPMAIRV